jgi:hypothetical protein
MTVAEKWLSILGAIGLLTAATLPGRNTVGVLGGIQKLISGTEGTAIEG